MKISRWVVAAMASALLGLVAGCAGAPSDSSPTPSAAAPAAAARPPSRLLDPAEFATTVVTPGVTTVNVHIPYAGDIPGTSLSVPYDRIGAETSRLPADHAAPLALYCRTGPMSAEAARTLAADGYTNIVELAGGMNAWRASGRPLLNPPGTDR